MTSSSARTVGVTVVSQALALVMLLSAAASEPSRGDQASLPATGTADVLSPVIDGPPAPLPPAVISRDQRGRATIRAVRLDQALKIDGRLHEEVYGVIPAASDFIQQEPHEGEPATEKTETWVFFDNTNLYIAARCWDTHPERWVLDDVRRDGDGVTQNDNFVVVFDTFYDRRNGFFFQTTPLGAMRDQLITDELTPNGSWNTVWTVRTGRFEGGWTAEFSIPFKSLRYYRSGPQVWGINFRRTVRWKNEASFLTRVPAAYGIHGINRFSVAATLVGLETPAQSMNLELKPYAMSTVTTDRVAALPFANKFSWDGGIDFKYGVTRGLTADVTYNTDFAQVEEDLQQVNLTRFSLFFPEKRDFFLEGQGIYGFGGVSFFNVGQAGDADDVPLLFFSRRIGLSEGQAVPVVAGARLTGKLGGFTIGALEMRTDDAPAAHAVATNFSVVRIKRDILRNSSIGVIATHRTPHVSGGGSNVVAGVDANMLISRTLTLLGYYAHSQSPGETGNESSYRARVEYSSDTYGLQAEQLMVAEGFNPEIGFMRRSDFRRSSVQARFSPRPRASRLIRKLTWESSFDYVTNASGETVENRDAAGSFVIDFNNSDQWDVEFVRSYEYLPRDFRIAPDVFVPTGSYLSQLVRSSYSLGRQHRVSGRLTVSRGTFYDGLRTEAAYSLGHVTLTPRVSLEPNISLNWVDLPQATFTTRLFGTRAIVMPSPTMSISSLVQYNASAHTISSSVRLRWEYTGGSELFVVYSDMRDTAVRHWPLMLNRSFALKLTRLIRF